MAGKYITIKCHARSLKHFRSLIKITVDIVRINKCDLKRNGIQHRFQLFDRHMTACQKDLPSCSCGFRHKLCCFRSLPDTVGYAKAIRIIFRIPIDTEPFFFRKIERTVRKKDICLLIDHLLCSRKHRIQTLLPRFILFVGFLRQRSEFIPNLVIHRPHHIGWSADLVFHFQMRIK